MITVNNDYHNNLHDVHNQIDYSNPDSSDLLGCYNEYNKHRSQASEAADTTGCNNHRNNAMNIHVTNVVAGQTVGSWNSQNFWILVCSNVLSQLYKPCEISSSLP